MVTVMNFQVGFDGYQPLMETGPTLKTWENLPPVAAFVWFSLVEFVTGVVKEARLLYLLLGKGTVLQIRTPSPPNPVLTSRPGLWKEVPCDSLALETCQQRQGDHVAGMRKNRFREHAQTRSPPRSRSVPGFCNT